MGRWWLWAGQPRFRVGVCFPMTDKIVQVTSLLFLIRGEFKRSHRIWGSHLAHLHQQSYLGRSRGERRFARGVGTLLPQLGSPFPRGPRGLRLYRAQVWSTQDTDSIILLVLLSRGLGEKQ